MFSDSCSLHQGFGIRMVIVYAAAVTPKEGSHHNHACMRGCVRACLHACMHVCMYVLTRLCRGVEVWFLKPYVRGRWRGRVGQEGEGDLCF